MKRYFNQQIKTFSIILILILGVTTNVKAQETDNTNKYKVYKVSGINTEYQDFGPMYFKGDLVYASVGRNKYLPKQRYKNDKIPFLDLYIALIQDSTNLVKEVDYFLIDKLNSAYHESNAAFTSDYKTIYFTRNNYIKKRYKTDREGVNRLKLFKAKRNAKDNGWEDLEELPFNSDEYSTGHPSISADGKTLYFTSDMPGGFGQTDIYKVAINDDGTYGEVINLGEKVNTPNKEMFPYISKNDKLYFSSNGRNGYGGLDIFKYKINSNVKATNLGAPINSIEDDFSIVFNESQNPRRGYFSSNRSGGMGDDDIYGFTEIPVKKEVVVVKACDQIVDGYVGDNSVNLPLANAKVVIKDSANKIIQTLTTDAQGKFSYKLPCNKNYTAHASLEYYKPNQARFNTTNRAKVNINLSLLDDFTYNDRKEIIIKIKPVYFDTNKSSIRPDASIELDNIVRIMNKYPKIIIKASSHTDSRGRDASNQALSKRRAESTMRYITGKGVAASRISAKGYGETQLTNNCDNNTKCSKAEHQLNRRTEFVIVKL